MDKKIIAIILVVIVAVAAVAVYVATSNNNNGKAEASDYVELGLTNNFFPDHTCCVIAANYKFMKDNPVILERFLAGYYDGVNFVNNALKDTSSEDYQWLVQFTMTKVPNLTEDEVKSALADIEYLYADGTDGNLAGLKNDMVDLLAGLKEVNALTREVANPTSFVNNYVDDTYLKAAIEKASPYMGQTAKVKVAVITGDIHQIAIHVAQAKNYFDTYKIETELSGSANGGGVATALLNGDCVVGFLGAPPATIQMVNNGYIDSVKVQDEDKAFNIVARVNSEGSGLFIDSKVLDKGTSDVPMRNGTPFYTVKGDEYVVSTENAKAWGGLVFGTPGTTSIQHIQLLTLATKLGLRTQMYIVGTDLQSNTLYYVANLSNYELITTNPYINGGIIWEPQYQRVVQEA
jgi:ABC-type nitrate/sulfonate/bicarbonate transport system substrate-binding protein